MSSGQRIHSQLTDERNHVCVGHFSPCCHKTTESMEQDWTWRPEAGMTSYGLTLVTDFFWPYSPF